MKTIEFVVDTHGNVTIEGALPRFTSVTLQWIRGVDHRVRIHGNYISFLGAVYQIEEWDMEHHVLNLRLVGDYR